MNDFEIITYSLIALAILEIILAIYCFKLMLKGNNKDIKKIALCFMGITILHSILTYMINFINEHTLT